jgi:hypothetical protein
MTLTLTLTYIDTIALNFPSRQVSALLINDPPLYEDIRWDDGLSPIPQATLDGMMLGAYQSNVVDIITDYRTNWIDGGIEYQSSLFDADPISISNITGTIAYIAIGAPLPPGFTWRDHNNTNHPFTAAGFGSFYATCVGWINLVYNVSWQHKANVADLTTVTDVLAYDFTYGWPRSDIDLGTMMSQLEIGTPLNTVMTNLTSGGSTTSASLSQAKAKIEQPKQKSKKGK